jgi:preprotein translocase subunit YajC
MADLPPLLAQIVYFLTPISLISLIFIFLVFKPQQKKVAEHKRFIDGLKSGDEVVTYGGMIGVIHKIDGDILYLKIDQTNGTIIRITRNNVMERYQK